MSNHAPHLSWRAVFDFVRSFSVIDWAIIALIIWMVWP
jgi:hypothetical protein